MAERKVLIKYFSPDFDPSKLEKVKHKKDKQDNVRMMLPMSVRCNTCGNFLYIGTKFNMRKETCLDMDYLGIKIFRFYFKCTCCHSQITMRTDPKQHDYVCEHGASRNYEARRDIAHAETILQAQLQLDSENDKMKKLENKTYDSKREMDILDALEEVKQMNKRLQNATGDNQLLLSILQKNEKPEPVQKQPEQIDTSFLKFKRIREDDEKTADNFDDDEMKQLLSGHYIEEVADPFSLMSAAEHLEMADKKEPMKQPPSPKVGQKRKQEDVDEKVDVKANILKNCMKIQKIEKEQESNPLENIANNYNGSSSSDTEE